MDKVRLLNVLLGLNFLLSLGFAFASFVAADKCYVEPCMHGDGLDVLYKVSHGLGFEVVVSGFLYCFQSLYGLRVLNKAQTGQSVQMGIAIGISFMAAISSLQNAVMWGSQALMVDDLTGRYISEVDGGTDVISTVNKMTRSTFTALAVFGSMIFVVTLFSSVFLFMWKDELLNDTSSSSTGYNTDFAPEDGVGYGNSAPSVPVSAGESSYQDAN